VGVGHEQQGLRPVLIISEDALNHSGFGLVIALPLTTNTSQRSRSRVLVNPPEGGLTALSAIMCEQILRLDAEQRLIKKLGKVSSQTLYQVSLRLALILGIE